MSRKPSTPQLLFQMRLSRAPTAEAASAVAASAAPFRELPKQTYSSWRTFTAVFDAKEACKNQ